MDRIKCTACKRMKMKEDYLKNGKTLKTCIACRDKKKESLAEPVQVKKLIEVPVIQDPVTKPVIAEPVKEPIQKLIVEPVPAEPITVPLDLDTVPVNVKSQWVYLSRKWIKQGDEEKLHKTLTEKLNREFKKRSAFAVHKYLTKWIMVDIRDR
jgi:hypothetical protein